MVEIRFLGRCCVYRCFVRVRSGYGMGSFRVFGVFSLDFF